MAKLNPSVLALGAVLLCCLLVKIEASARIATEAAPQAQADVMELASATGQ